jgi:diacylglycerol O-acyltransferase
MILLEGDQTPMHIGSLLVLEVPEVDRAGAAQRLRAHLLERLPSTPLMRLLRQAPLSFDSDVWIGASTADLDDHVVIEPTDGPLTDGDLHAFVEEQVMVRLDLSRPPFRIHILDPVEGGRMAMYVKVHHSVTDGIGFQTVLGLLSDEPLDDAVVPSPLSTELPPRHEWLATSVARFREARQHPDDSRARRKAAVEALRDPELQRAETPSYALSGATSTERAYTRITVSFPEVRSIAHALGATINDLLLVLTGTAMRSYLLEHGQLPDAPLVTNAARSYRRPEHGLFGNRIVAIHPHLATNVADPIERLRAIQASMAIERRRTVHDEAMLNAPETPFGPYVRRRRFAERRSGGGNILPGNLTVSNVPGPAGGRSYAGFRQRSNHPTALLGSGRVVNFTARRNGDAFDIGLMSDPTKVPDVEHLADLFRAALAEYRALAEGGTTDEPGI